MLGLIIPGSFNGQALMLAVKINLDVEATFLAKPGSSGSIVAIPIISTKFSKIDVSLS